MASIRKRNWTTADGEEKTAWVADYFDQARKRHIKTFTRKKDADAWLVNAQGEVQRGVHTPASASVTIAEAGEDWIAQGETDGLERSTLMQYRQHLEFHITPLIGAVKLAELAPAMVQDFQNRLVKGEGGRKRSRTMAQKVVASLGAILANAMARGRVARNVVRDQIRSGSGKRQRRLEKRHMKRVEVGVDIPTKDEIRGILAHAEGRYRPLIVTAIFTGLRASELRGLRWDDVDLDAGILTVRQRADRWGTIGSPKSDAGKREMPLAPMVINTLREWRLACPRQKAAEGDGEGRLWLVFPNSKGNVDSLPNMHRRGLGPMQVAAGLAADPSRPKYGLHSFRHAAASLFIEQGFTPKRVQALMGHSSIQVTFDTYGHLFPSQAEDRAAMQQMQARLVG
jgi:integrase